MSLDNLIKIGKKIDFGTLYVKPAFVFQVCACCLPSIGTIRTLKPESPRMTTAASSFSSRRTQTQLSVTCTVIYAK